jgi:hypothetical protein
MSLGMNTLADFLAVRGLNTSGRKVELVARAFSAVELKLPILASSEEQQAKLKIEYEKRLSSYQICDPLNVADHEKSEEVTKFPPIDCGVIFSYILQVRDFDLDYIGRYKDQKAYSYWDSGFVDKISTYEPHQNKTVVYIYGSVRASFTASVTHKLWILVKKNPAFKILTCWCSCMSGTSQSCNHAIAVMYKIEYALRKGYMDPACTSMPCSWNQATKREIEPKMIRDITIRKKMRSTEKDEGNREEVRRNDLQNFNPVLPAYQSISDDSVSTLYQQLYIASPESALFKCIPMEEEDEENPIFSLKVAAAKFHTVQDEEERVDKFLKSLPLSKHSIVMIEKKTRGQAENTLWFQARAGRLTASLYHDIFTKVNSLTKSKATIRPKVTPLLSRIMFHDDKLSHIIAIKWGRDNEHVALKQFYTMEAVKHNNFKINDAGLFVHSKKAFIAASPDGVASCKCHGEAVIEIKCPYKIRDEFIDGRTDCDFLDVSDPAKMIIKRSHKYFTQIIGQMAVTQKKLGYFVVWTKKDMFVEVINTDEVLWEKVERNLAIFFKAYVCPILLDIKQLYCCGTCEGILLNENEISEKEEQDHNSINCDHCMLWFHLKCQKITVKEAEKLPDEWHCDSCLLSLLNDN